MNQAFSHRYHKLPYQQLAGLSFETRTNLLLDPKRFPDPNGMAAELHRLNARLMVSVWPIMDPKSDNNKEMYDQGYLLGNGATYDAFQ